MAGPARPRSQRALSRPSRSIGCLLAPRRRPFRRRDCAVPAERRPSMRCRNRGCATQAGRAAERTPSSSDACPRDRTSTHEQIAVEVRQPRLDLHSHNPACSESVRGHELKVTVDTHVARSRLTPDLSAMSGIALDRRDALAFLGIVCPCLRKLHGCLSRVRNRQGS